jgi:hypothetical protein
MDCALKKEQLVKKEAKALGTIIADKRLWFTFCFADRFLNVNDYAASASFTKREAERFSNSL